MPPTRRAFLSAGVASTALAGCLGYDVVREDELESLRSETRRQEETIADLRAETRRQEETVADLRAELAAREESVDVFLVAGQSNSRGRGDRAASPDTPLLPLFAFDDGRFTRLVDPVGDAETGSAWPAFGQVYYARRHRPTALAIEAVGGTAQHVEAANDESDPHWDDGGTLRRLAADEVRECLSRVELAGQTAHLRGVLWAQGERDAQAIDAGELTPREYQAALRDMIRWFRSELGDGLRFFVFQTGRKERGDTPGFAAVRNAQEQIAADDPRTHLVFAGAKLFPVEGKMGDNLHYSQAGYDEMGATGASNVARIVESAAGEG
jgi:hypothetical protein